jgi:DNA-binding HxlR family transcriptional regulator
VVIRVKNIQICPKFEAVFNLLGKRWTGLIIHALLGGPKRFKDISEMIPHINDRMLSERFKELEAEAIVERKVYPEKPVRVEYELTEKGKLLRPALEELQKWGEMWFETKQSEI